MTINVAVVTAEALVFGCDSISSVTQYLIDPFQCAIERQSDDSLCVRVTARDLQPHVMNTWSGVTKMFALSDRHTPVAAVTAGLARLNERSISSYANEFLSDSQTRPAPETVEEVAQAFLQFIRRHYEEHYADSNTPEQYRDAPCFLVGGYGRRDHLPQLFRIDVLDNKVSCEYGRGKFGVSWEGQADAVERVIRGCDTLLRNSVAQQIAAGIQATHPDAPPLSIEWDGFKCKIPYGKLPVQDAVDFAAYLVALQSGMCKFASGVATVGGRIHIGVITKHEGFRMLDEPELRLTQVGCAA